MKYCVSCGSKDIIELYLEKQEYWCYCYNCKSCFEVNFPDVPYEEFANKLEEQGFEKDAQRFREGKRLSKYGE